MSPLDEPGGDLADQHAVHALRSGTEDATQSGGTELELAVEAVLELALGGVEDAIPILVVSLEDLRLSPNAHNHALAHLGVRCQRRHQQSKKGQAFLQPFHGHISSISNRRRLRILRH